MAISILWRNSFSNTLTTGVELLIKLWQTWYFAEGMLEDRCSQSPGTLPPCVWVLASGGRLWNKCWFMLVKTAYLQNLWLRRVHSWHYRVHNFSSLQKVQKTEGEEDAKASSKDSAEPSCKISQLKVLIEMEREKQVFEWLEEAKRSELRGRRTATKEGTLKQWKDECSAAKAKP